jgi:hypothetical protein
LLITVPPYDCQYNAYHHICDCIFPIEYAGKQKHDARSTCGDEIRNENVTPMASPALVKTDINNGLEEQEQKGVIVPAMRHDVCPDSL